MAVTRIAVSRSSKATRRPTPREHPDRRSGRDAPHLRARLKDQASTEEAYSLNYPGGDAVVADLAAHLAEERRPHDDKRARPKTGVVATIIAFEADRGAQSGREQ